MGGARVCLQVHWLCMAASGHACWQLHGFSFFICALAGKRAWPSNEVFLHPSAWQILLCRFTDVLACQGLWWALPELGNDVYERHAPLQHLHLIPSQPRSHPCRLQATIVWSTCMHALSLGVQNILHGVLRNTCLAAACAEAQD